MGVEPTLSGIRSYLHELLPSSNQIARAKVLIDQLGSHSYYRRESAMDELVRMGAVPSELLIEASKSSSSEVAYRARKIIRAREGGDRQALLYAALSTIAECEIKGLAADIFAVLPLIEEDFLITVANRSIEKTTTAKDKPLIDRALRHESTMIRIAAIHGLVSLKQKASVNKLIELLETDVDRERLVIANWLARLGNRKCFIPLGELLESELPRVRAEAAAMLRSISGKRFAFSAHADAKNREKTIQMWKEWIRDNHENAEIRPPGSKLLLGRTLLTLLRQNKLIEIDANGNKVWEVQLSSPFPCQGLPNGHRVVGLYTGKTVIEYDATGKEIWRATDLPRSISGIDRLDNGNTLVACGQADNQILEVDRKGNKVWSKTIEGMPVDAKMMDTGRILLALMQSEEVAEIDRLGTIHRKFKVDGRPYTVQPLKNGNTFVRFSKGGVAEYSPEGKRIWQAESGKGYSAQRLPNGNTLIADEKGYRVLDQGGNVVSENNEYTGYLYISRF